MRTIHPVLTVTGTLVLLSALSIAGPLTVLHSAPAPAPAPAIPAIHTFTPATPAALWFDPAIQADIDWFEVGVRVSEDFAGDVCLEATITVAGGETKVDCTSWATD